MSTLRTYRNRLSLTPLACFVSLQLLAARAFAQLPTQADPDSGTVRDAASTYKSPLRHPAGPTRP